MIDIFLDRLTFLLRRLEYLLPVLVRPSIKKYFRSRETFVAGNDIRLDYFKRKPDMRFRVYIGQRRGEVKKFSGH